MAFQTLSPGTLLSPVPAVMVSCALPGKRPNVITVAWAGTVCSDPPMLSISVRKERFSHHILLESGEFVVNLVGREQLQAADYCGVRHCIGCGNGLDALVLILKALGIGAGDEVIAPSNTFIATVLAISYAMNDMMERKVGRWQWAVYGMTAFSVVLFAAFYPVLIGLMVPSWYPTRFLRWIPGGAWPF